MDAPKPPAPPPAPPDEPVDATRRRLLRMGAYVAPAVIGVLTVGGGGCQPVASCNPNRCMPRTQPCGPDGCNPNNNCAPLVGCTPQGCMPRGGR